MALRNQSNAKKQLYKVILLGDGGVGKSCLMNRYIANKFDSQSFHTIGVEFLNKEVNVQGKAVTLQIWDTAGQERFKSLRTPFYRGADCCLLTFALDDLASFKNLSMWRTEFLYYSNVEDELHFPFVILGNKADLENQKVNEDEIKAWCDSYRYPYFETSAKEAQNVDEAFECAVTKLLQLDQQMPNQFSDQDRVTLSRAHPGERVSSSCC